LAVAFGSIPLPPKRGRFEGVWAKSAKKGEERGESLIEHTTWVLRNLALLRDRVPRLDRTCDMERFWARIAAAVVLHDLGKCARGFQDAVQRQIPFPYRHEELSVLFVPWLTGNIEEDSKWISAAVLTHHRDLNNLPAPDDGMGAQATKDFVNTGTAIAREIWPECARLGFVLPDEWEQNISEEPAILDPVKSIDDQILDLRNLRDELRGTEILSGMFLRGLLMMADHAGSAHVRFGSMDELQSPEAMHCALIQLPPGNELFRHQTEASMCASNAILTAPTGSGKTEAAMLWAARRSAHAGSSPVLFYVLPYQASMNAMKRRMEDKLDKRKTGKIALQHSRMLQALYRQLLETDIPTGEALEKARWEKHLARLHATPIRVMSPYQLLRGAYQLKGHEAIWTDAAGGSFIFDEIHAYEPNRLGMILATLRHLLQKLDARAMVMSATLPTRLRRVLEDVLPSPAAITADAPTFRRFERHEVHVLHDDLMSDGLAERIRRDSAEGKAVLVVANTVGRAQELWGRFGENTELLHGRFHSEDRARKEMELSRRQGSGTRCGKPVLLVATQVVEVSLNVDFDVLYSDPAPLEALLQRFGRVNRKQQKEKPEPKPVYVCEGLPEKCTIYDRDLVAAAVDQLAQWDGRVLSEDRVQGMLDCVYKGSRGEIWEQQLRGAIIQFDREVLSASRPFTSDERIKKAFEDLFEGQDVLPVEYAKEYERRRDSDDEAVLAEGLMVPITSGQFHRLRRARLLDFKGGYVVARVAYGCAGLDLDTPMEEDGV
jgi:CRISPR-associated endonuclease/helicase Cas3